MLDPNHFRNLLNNPETTVEEDLEQLEQLLEEHPYLQSARALQLKIYKQKNSELYNEALRKTAAHTIDRDVLFQFITSKAFIDQEIEKETQETFESGTIEKQSLTEEVVENNKQNEIEESINHRQVKEIDVSNKKEEDTEDIKQESPEETLKLDHPLSFDKEDSYSFSEWLQLTSYKSIDRKIHERKEETTESKSKESQENPIPPKTEKVIHMVDAFLKNNPRPKRKSVSYEHDDSEQLTETDEAPKSLMTETLARVYLQQKNYNKAIQAYKILILRNPEKSGYFADKIKAIEKITNKK